jgi:prepilin-type N-terminal cleavage/methylation domain-containing protein
MTERSDRGLIGIARRGVRENGFSLLEVVIVVAIVLILAAMAIPQVVNMMTLFKLRNSCTEFAGIVQQARSRSVQDSKYYSVYFNTSATGMTEAFVNVKGNTIDPLDPIVSWSPEVQPKPLASAPSTGTLKSAFLSSVTGYTLYDANLQTTPITFGPMGLPCNTAGGTVCATPGAAVAYWTFFQDTRSQQWEAVTVTPAGKIQKWMYSGTTWSLL